MSRNLQQCCILSLRLYQLLISPQIASRCRFFPTCSNYSIECIERFGTISGVTLSLKRIVKCHPWHEAGIDLPPKLDKTNKHDDQRR